MSGPVGSSTWFGEPGYNLDQSLRFNQPSDTTLSKTFASAGNRKTWTFSAWVKIGNPAAEGGNQLGIFGTYTGNNDTANIQFDGSGELHFEDYSGSYAGGLQVTEAKQRDVSSWYHIMVVYDTTQGTAANRIKLYVNSSLLPSKTGGAHVLPDQNHDGKFNNTAEHKIGMVNGTYCWDGYMAEVNFIDGTALGPESFGTTGVHGQWIPIEYTGVYGTNGFNLNFANSGVLSATGGNSTATDGDYKAASFTSSGTFTPSADGYVEYLVIAGGGGGGSNSGGDEGGGGGGAGGYRTGYLPVTASTAYSITVGGGGLGRADGAGAGGDGGNSVFPTITSIGGGGGGSTDSDTARSGGSGGGMGSNNSYTAGAGTAGQGNAGGTGNGWHGGGGGGAGQVGGNYTAPNSTNGNGGNGGNGLASSITGSSVTRAGGGGGGTWNSANYTGQSPGAGGSGGGGAGGATIQGVGSAGTVNTGGGGGGAGNNLASGAGGSGIVIIRYKFQ